MALALCRQVFILKLDVILKLPWWQRLFLAKQKDCKGSTYVLRPKQFSSGVFVHVDPW